MATADMACVPTLREPGGRSFVRGSTPRTRRLAEDAVVREYGRFYEQAELAAATPDPDIPNLHLRTAHRFRSFYPCLTPVVREDELIVGARLRETGKGSVMGWMPDGFLHYTDNYAKNVPDDRPDLREKAVQGLFSPQGSFNHKVCDYAGFIRTGSLALARRAREVAERRAGDERDFALAFAIGHETLIAHAETYAAECERKASPASPERAAELLEIARICRKVPAHPAETFHEAVQSVWFAYMAAGDATGRVDVYLNDFYEADLAAGRITPERAQELIECLLIKLHGDVMESVINVSSVQTMTLGGVLPDGSDATNALTRLFLQAIRSVRLLRPTVYVRCHEDTPPDVLELAVTMLGEGLAEPNFFGDRPVIEGLVRLGIPLHDARDYALSGCAEVCSPGKGNWGAPNGWINLAGMADEALRECAAGGCTTREGVWAALERHAARLAEACRVCNQYVDERLVEPYFTQTLMMPVTLERCRDIGHGGLETHLAHWEGIGLSNAADMVFAAGQLVCDEGDDPAALFARLDAGAPELFARLGRLPRYGNGHAGVDEVARRLVNVVADALERTSTPFRRAFVLGHLAGGENMHINYGHLMGATLDGRRAGRPLGDSMAGTQGRTVSGPTATVRSLCALDHSRIVAGSVSTLRLCGADFATAESRSKVVALIRTYIAGGGSQLQVNIVDAQTLRRAQERPEEYAGLMVRVAGYSADFTRIGRSLQDEIIARTEGFAGGA